MRKGEILMELPEKRTAGVFSYEGIPPAGQLIPLGLQHVVAAVVGVITPAIILSGSEVCSLSAGEKATLIQASLVITALATLLQLFPPFHRIGSRLPVIMGISFAYVPALTAIGGQFGLPVILGAELIGGLIAVVFGIFVRPIRKLFPPLVTGTVIFTIGISLYPTAVHYMAGGDAAGEWFGGVRSWGVALFTFAVVVLLSNFARGIWKLGSLLFGMIAGYIAAFLAGIVDLSGVAKAPWVSLPQWMPFEIEFVPSAIASLAIVYIVNSVQTIGDLTSTTMGGMGRVPTDKELSGGIVGQGIMSVIGVFFGGLPVASFSQNVGIVTVNKVINRAVFAFSAGILLIAGLMPKFASVLTTIPQCVIGGATLSVFAAIAMTGIRMIASDGEFTMRKSTVAGLSVALGTGITQVPGCLSGSGFPDWVATVFGSTPVVAAAVMAIILNLVLPKDQPAGE